MLKRTRQTSRTASPNTRPDKRAIPTRLIAILVMLLGVGGFVITQAVFDGSLPLLILSTLITFGGLAWLRSMPKFANSTEDLSKSEGHSIRVGHRQPVEDDQNAVDDEQDIPRQAPAPHTWTPAPAQPRWTPPTPAAAPMAAAPAGSSTLAHQVTAHFRRQGARVETEASKAGKTILRVYSNVGIPALVMVLENPAPVDVGEARGLFALVTSTSSKRGYLIAPGPFTQRASDWVREKPIWLVEASRLETVIL